MILNEENYIEWINSYDRVHWSTLLELIPEIEKTSKFGNLVVGEKNPTGVAQIPFYNYSPVVRKFHKAAYDLNIIIGFNWIDWDEGQGIAHDKNFDFDKIDIPTKCKLITAVIRNDRFNEGVLIAAFDSGLILNILKSIDRQLT